MSKKPSPEPVVEDDTMSVEEEEDSDVDDIMSVEGEKMELFDGSDAGSDAADDDFGDMMEVGSEEDEEEEDFDSEDLESDEDDDIETKQKKLELRAQREQAAAAEYKREQQAAQDEAAAEGEDEDAGEDGEDGTGKKKKVDAHKAMDITKIKAQMEEKLKMLANWKTAKLRSSKTRDEILEELVELVVLYYDYNAELARYYLTLFSPQEAIAWFEANEKTRPVTLRVNTLKTRLPELAKALTVRGTTTAQVGAWTPEGLKVVDTTVPVGATPEYLAGHYMVQSASSFVPVYALDPKQGETVLDMAAAPGGKATHIAQKMKNAGTLYCNELQKERVAGLSGNIHRLGVTNAIILNRDGRNLRNTLPPLDRVLLDAPCSGSGVASRDPSIKSKKTVSDFRDISNLQKELLLTAIDLVDANKAGIIVYSTCSVSLEENEMVVQHALKARNVKLVSFEKEIPFGEQGFTRFREHQFDPSMKLTQRFYPHRHNMDGFFVAKFEKISNVVPDRAKKEPKLPRAVLRQQKAEREKAREKAEKAGGEKDSGGAGRATVHWGNEKWAAMSSRVIDGTEDFETLTEKKKKRSKRGMGLVKDQDSSGCAGADSSSGEAGEQAGGAKSGKKAGKKGAAGDKTGKKDAAGDRAGKKAAGADKDEALAEKLRLFRTGKKGQLKKVVENEKKGGKGLPARKKAGKKTGGRK